MSRSVARAFALAAVALATLVTFQLYHDRPSYLPDDAIYAFSAAQAIGARGSDKATASALIRYSVVPNAVALKLFGESLVSLRYPLLLVLMVLTIGALALFSDRPLGDGLLAAAIMLSLTVVQFVNPASSWYCLAFAVLATLLLSGRRGTESRSLFILGLLVGLTFFTRQLSGVVLGAGVSSAVLFMLARDKESDDRTLARLLLLPAGLVALLLASRSITVGSWLLLGAAPTLILAWQAAKLRVWNPEVLRFCTWFTLGIVVSCLPLVIYHAANGTFVFWLQELFVRPMTFSWAAFSDEPSYSQYVLLFMESLVHEPTLRAAFSILFWAVLLLAPVVLGIGILIRLRNRDGTVPPAAVIPCFFAMGSLHLQIPNYLFYVSGFCLVGLLSLWPLSAEDPVARKAGKGILRLLIVVTLVAGITIHAGQPLGRNFHDQLVGNRAQPLETCSLERSGLLLPATSCDVLERVVDWVEVNSGPEEGLLALPASVEINVLSARRSPVTFANCALAVQNDDDLAATIARINRMPPKLLVVKQRDKYLSPRCEELLDAIGSAYEEQEAIGGYTLHVRRSLPSAP